MTKVWVAVGLDRQGGGTRALYGFSSEFETLQVIFGPLEHHALDGYYAPYSPFNTDDTYVYIFSRTLDADFSVIKDTEDLPTDPSPKTAFMVWYNLAATANRTFVGWARSIGQAHEKAREHAQQNVTWCDDWWSNDIDASWYTVESVTVSDYPVLGE